MAELKSILVTARERKIIDTLRELPDGELRQATEAFLLELSDLLAHPRCAEVQADGIPCGTAAADCEDCLQLTRLVEQMRQRLEQNAV